MTEELPAKFETVMIIDDNKMDLYITARIIKKNNFTKTILEYSSAVEALQYLQQHQGDTNMLPQVIFIDIYMPAMTGFEFVDAYDKLSEGLKNYCNIYILSSTIDSRDINKVTENKNIADFKEKPINTDFLHNIPCRISIL